MYDRLISLNVILKSLCFSKLDSCLCNRTRPAVCPSSAGKRRSLPFRELFLGSQRCRQKITGWRGTEAQKQRCRSWETGMKATLWTTLIMPKTLYTTPSHLSSTEPGGLVNSIWGNVHSIFIILWNPLYLNAYLHCDYFKMNFGVLLKQCHVMTQVFAVMLFGGRG